MDKRGGRWLVSLVPKAVHSRENHEQRVGELEFRLKGNGLQEWKALRNCRPGLGDTFLETGTKDSLLCGRPVTSNFCFTLTSALVICRGEETR